MPLKESAVNEILPFAADGREELGDVLSLEEYKTHPMRLRGHLPGLALRELQNRQSRQSSHVSAGVAQFIANRYEDGVKDDGNLDKIELGMEAAIRDVVSDKQAEQDIRLNACETKDSQQDKLIENLKKENAEQYQRIKKLEEIKSPFFLCDFYHFRRDDICEKDRRFVPAFGGLIENADVKYPEAWEYLKNYPNNGIEPLKLSEEDWQYWVRFFGGIGGGITYVQNLEAKTLRVPDLRGMFFEGARLLYGQNVGNYHLDQMRPITGTFQCSDYGFISRTGQGKPTGVFRLKSAGNGHVNVSGTPYDHYLTIELNTANLGFHYSGERTVPPAYFTLPTVFLGEYNGE